jgi:MFS family permease
MAGFALGGITVATWGPRLPALRADLGIGDAGIGLVLAGVTVGSITGLTASSAVLSALGPRRAIVTMLWLVAAGIATIGLGAGIGHSVPVTAVGFACVGLGIGAVDVGLNVEGSAVERAAGTTLMPLMHAAWSAGVIVGAAVGAAGAALALPIEGQFVGEAIFIAGAAAVAVRFLPETEPAPTGADRPPMAARIRAWLGGWLDGRLLLIGLVMLGVELGEGSANSWLTLAVRDGHHRPNAVAALFFVAFAVGETCTRVVGGPLVDRVGRVRAVRFTTALGAVGLVLFITADSAGLILVGTLLWAVGVSMGFPLGMSAAAESGPNPAGRVSVVASIGYLANLAGPPFIGFLSQSIGLLNALWLVVALFATGFAASGALRTRRPSPAPARGRIG